MNITIDYEMSEGASDLDGTYRNLQNKSKQKNLRKGYLSLTEVWDAANELLYMSMKT